MRGLLAIGVAVLALAGCSKKGKPVEVGPAPAMFRVNFETSKGTFVVEVHRDWAPIGADRFYELVQRKFFDNDHFFRVVKNFIVQFGINGKPDVMDYWRPLAIPDDPRTQSNTRGAISYAAAGPATRTTQVFINLADNAGMLDSQNFAPFGRVVEGMDVVDAIYSGYGEEPQQDHIQVQGNQYLTDHFPKLDYIKTARVASH